MLHLSRSFNSNFRSYNHDLCNYGLNRKLYIYEEYERYIIKIQKEHNITLLSILD